MQRAVLALVLFAVCAQAQMFQQPYDIRNTIRFRPSPDSDFFIRSLTPSSGGLPTDTTNDYSGLRFSPNYIQSFVPTRNFVLVNNPIANTVFGANSYQTSFTSQSQYVVVVAIPDAVDNFNGNTTYAEGDVVLVNWDTTPSATNLCGGQENIVLNAGTAFGGAQDLRSQVFCLVPTSSVVAKVTFNKAGTEAAPLFDRFNNVRRQPTIFGPVVFENFGTA